MPAVAALAREASFLGISAGDWLQAFSGIVGVVLTVLVTLWIEWRRRSSEERADLRIVDTAIRDLQSALDACEAPPPEDQNLQGRVTWAADAQKRLYEALPGYEFARSQAVVRDLSVFRELRYLDSALKNSAANIGSEYNILLGASGRVTGPVLAVNQAKVAEIAAYLRPFANKASDALRAKL